jgi:hypothetical protein
LPRLYAVAGQCPVPLASTEPADVLAWAEAVRDHFEEKRRAHVTLSGLIGLAPLGVAPTLAALYPDEAEEERYRAQATLDRRPAVEAQSGEAPAATKVLAKTSQGGVQASATQGAEGGKRYSICGHVVTAVLRRLGKAGWAVDRALRLLTALELPVAESTVKIQVRAGVTGDRGDPAPLTKSQLADLEALCPLAPSQPVPPAGPGKVTPTTSKSKSSSATASAATGTTSKSSKKRSRSGR